MIFNGHTHETIAEMDDVMMAQLQTMYADGLLGNRAIIELLGTLTNGVFNYMRADKSPPYKLVNILGSAYDYIFPPMSEADKKEQANNQLLAFMSQAPGFSADKFGVKDGK
ncbi:hypothetical protein UFOVP259_45 [uncultured Caudovirales phage]|uniref:Uncharacterized protein n=1 Tax=uncultured Caudovirales phage TaxID=2100421 RepID=A0A6J5LDB1_9CAUD|nr:hypothetical protein UFOVP259_45 [uncultured Caudovirales phage]